MPLKKFYYTIISCAIVFWRINRGIFICFHVHDAKDEISEPHYRPSICLSVSLAVCRSSVTFSAPYLPHSLTDGYEILLKYFTYRDDMQETWVKIKFLRSNMHFCPPHISHTFWRMFMKIGPNVQSTKASVKGMSQPFWRKVTHKGQMFEPAFCVHAISSIFFKGLSWKFAQVFSSLRQCGDGMSQPFWLKVEVTLFKLSHSALKPRISSCFKI